MSWRGRWQLLPFSRSRLRSVGREMFTQDRWPRIWGCQIRRSTRCANKMRLTRTKGLAFVGGTCGAASSSYTTGLTGELSAVDASPHGRPATSIANPAPPSTGQPNAAEATTGSRTPSSAPPSIHCDQATQYGSAIANEPKGGNTTPQSSASSAAATPYSPTTSPTASPRLQAASQKHRMAP